MAQTEVTFGRRSGATAPRTAEMPHIPAGGSKQNLPITSAAVTALF